MCFFPVVSVVCPVFAVCNPMLWSSLLPEVCSYHSSALHVKPAISYYVGLQAGIKGSEVAPPLHSRCLASAM